MSDDTGTDWAALADVLEDWPYGQPRVTKQEAELAAVGLRRLTQLDTAIGQQVAELRAIHHPQWASPDGGYTTERRDGYTPVGCAECYPHDGSWPCVTAMVADDLAAVLGSGEQPAPPTTCPTCGNESVRPALLTGGRVRLCPDSWHGEQR